MTETILVILKWFFIFVTVAWLGSKAGYERATESLCQQAVKARLEDQLPICKEWKRNLIGYYSKN